MLRAFFNKLYDRKPSLAMLSALSAVSFVGLSPIFVRISEIGPISTAFYRFFLALPLLWSWMIFDNLKSIQPRSPRTARDYFLLISCGVFLALDIAFWHWALIRTSVVNATLINNMTSIFVALSAWLFLKERMHFSMLLGILMSVTGALVLVGADIKGGHPNLFGDCLALISAVFYTAYILAVKELRHHFSAPTIMAWGGMSSMYVLAGIAFIGGDDFFPATSTGWLSLLGLAIIVHIAGQGLLAYSIGHLSATFSSVALMFSPIVSTVAAWFLFSEALTSTKMIGGLIVLLGIFIARRDEKTIKKLEKEMPPS